MSGRESETVQVALQEEDEQPTVVVQVPAHAEPADEFHAVLEGIAAQTDVDYDVAHQAWVTPTDGELLAVAEEHDAFDAVEAPDGKLRARNAAHDAAIDDGADVVVTWDADAMPKHPRVLAALLEPFEEPAVVATYGAPRAPRSNPVNVMVNAIAKIEDHLHPHVNSQLSAMSAYAWTEFGGFDVDMDQTDDLAVRRHEEFEFYRALSDIGAVRRTPGAVVLEEPRRPMYHLTKAFDRFPNGYPQTEWEQQRGVTSFEHVDDEGES